METRRAKVFRDGWWVAASTGGFSSALFLSPGSRPCWAEMTMRVLSHRQAIPVGEARHSPFMLSATHTIVNAGVSEYILRT